MHGLSIVKGNRAIEIGNALSELSGNLDLEIASSMIVLASFFESENLLVDAGTYYQIAIDMAPGNKTYHNYFTSFVTRHQLVK